VVSRVAPASRRIDLPAPYRVLFPLGLAFALLGTAPWVVYGLGHGPYPGPLHRALMIQGFEASFVLGFLLTALPGMTHSERCRPAELAAATLATLMFGVAALAGATVVAQAAFLGALLVLGVVIGRRLPRSRIAPPAEMIFVLFGLLAGLAGAVLQLLTALGVAVDPAPRFGERLVSLGMVLSLVLGVGGMLVPVFIGLSDPLRIPGFARAHDRPARLRFYAGIVAALAFAFVAEAMGHPIVGSATRAVAATVVGVLVWKLVRPPGRREVPAWALWTSGWLVIAGLWLAAAIPARPLAGIHVVFIGGFGMLTMGIATRVVVAHGGHPPAIERRLLGWLAVIALIVAAGSRAGADFAPRSAALHWGGAAALWMFAWLMWGIRALPRMLRTNATIPREPVAIVPAARLGSGVGSRHPS
jgi:uncharacterized protein involved in response to NO